MFSQIVRIDNGNIKLYINQSRAEHDNVIRALIDDGYKPKTSIKTGISNFIKWFKKYNKIK